MKDGRRHYRVPYVGPIRLKWDDARGNARFVQGKCIDVSENGLRVEVPTRIEPGTRIFLNAERIKLSGAAAVKHVERSGARYILGLELSEKAQEKTLAALAEPWTLRSPSGVL